MKTHFKLAVALLALSASPAMAQLYSGAAAGRVDHKQNRADWAQAAASSTYEDTNAGYKVFVGYKFNDYLGVEGGYNYLGKRSATIARGASTGKANVKTDAWDVFGVGTLPLPNNFSVFAKLGVSSNYSKMDFSSSGGAFLASDSGTNRKTSLAWGLGAGYGLTKNLTVRLEYEAFGNAGETNNGFTIATKTSDSKPKLISIGLVHAF